MVGIELGLYEMGSDKRVSAQAVCLLWYIKGFSVHESV